MSDDAPTAATRLYALLGNPVSHSLSPALQNAAFRAAGEDALYIALRCDAAELAGLIAGLARAGGGGNITLPHKQLATTVIDVPTGAVRRTGACNTFWAEAGRLCGDNTDVAAFDAAVRSLLPDPHGARVLLLGAGGAARAVVAALLDAGAGRVDVLNRSAANARALLDVFRDAGERLSIHEQPDADDERWDLVVNATALGLHPGDALPLDAATTARCAAAAFDLVYAPHGTAWVRAARTHGIPAADGLEMLMQQAAASFARWCGRAAPLDTMRAALARSAMASPRGGP